MLRTSKIRNQIKKIKQVKSKIKQIKSIPPIEGSLVSIDTKQTLCKYFVSTNYSRSISSVSRMSFQQTQQAESPSCAGYGAIER